MTTTRHDRIVDRARRVAGLVRDLTPETAISVLLGTALVVFRRHYRRDPDTLRAGWLEATAAAFDHWKGN